MFLEQNQEWQFEMNRKLENPTVIAMGIFFFVSGVILSVGAGYGFIEPSSSIDGVLDVRESGFHGPQLLAEIELKQDDSVIIEFTDWNHPDVKGINLTLYVEESTGAILKAQEFNYLGDEHWEPNWANDTEKPAHWSLFATEKSGVYSVYTSAFLPPHSPKTYLEVSFRTIVLRSDLYTDVLLLGLVLLALGVIIVAVGALARSSTKTFLS